MSARIRHLSISHRPVFLLNSRLNLFSAASFEALLIPKLRSHFAEFLNKCSPVRLRILSSPTCVGLRYGHLSNTSSFSRQREISGFGTCCPYPSKISLMNRVLHCGSASLLGPALPSTGSAYPSVSLLRCFRWYWNFNQLSIAYDFTSSA